MQQTILYVVSAVLLLSVGAAAGATIGNSDTTPFSTVFNHEQQNRNSPYAGQQERAIKYLAPSDINALENGKGGALGGLAKPAELNSYPGPRHVLDSADELNLSAEQETAIQDLFDEMKAEAQPVGKEFLAVERKIDNAYANRTMTDKKLETLLDRSGDLYGELRYVHLTYHFQTTDILTQQQIRQYDQIRGYGSGSHGGGHDEHM